MGEVKTMMAGRNMKVGKTPAIVLINPKYPHNVGGVVRAASNFDFKQVWFTGDRVSLKPEKGTRLPREERMKGYQDVELRQHNYPLECFEDAVPVAVELRPGCEQLPEFEHPENAVYLFGPEDGSIKSVFLQHCHRFVVIPSQHCLNLAAAVNVVLYDRMIKEWMMGKKLPELKEARGWAEPPTDCVY